MEIQPLRTVRSNFSEYVERVQTLHERFIVTKNGVPAVMLVNPDDIASLEETISVLSDSGLVKDLIQANQEYLDGDIVEGVEEVRALLADG